MSLGVVYILREMHSSTQTHINQNTLQRKKSILPFLLRLLACSIGKQHNGVLVLLQRKGRIRQTVKVTATVPHKFSWPLVNANASGQYPNPPPATGSGDRARKWREEGEVCLGENDVCSVQSLHHFHLTWPPIRPSMHIV